MGTRNFAKSCPPAPTPLDIAVRQTLAFPSSKNSQFQNEATYIVVAGMPAGIYLTWFSSMTQTYRPLSASNLLEVMNKDSNLIALQLNLKVQLWRRGRYGKVI